MSIFGNPTTGNGGWAGSLHTVLALSPVTTVLGDLISILFIGASGGLITSVLDSAGNNFTVSADLGGGNAGHVYYAYCLAATHASASNVITITFTSSQNFASGFAWDYPLTGGTASFDTDLAAGAFADGTSTTPTSASFSTTGTTDEIVNVIVGNDITGITYANVSPFTLDNGSFNSGVAGTEHASFTSVQSSITAGFTSSNADFTIGVAGFVGTATPTAATPTFSPNGGAFGPAQTVTISSTTSGGTIYYTTDGSTPNHSSPSISNGGTISVSVTETVKAIEVAGGFLDSAVGSASFTINGAVTTSTFSPAAGLYTSPQSVSLLNADSGLTGFAQYYTLDGSTPTTGSTLYTGAISISTTTTIKVLAVATNYSNSAIATGLFSFGTPATGVSGDTGSTASAIIESPRTSVMGSNLGTSIIG